MQTQGGGGGDEVGTSNEVECHQVEQPEVKPAKDHSVFRDRGLQIQTNRPHRVVSEGCNY